MLRALGRAARRSGARAAGDLAQVLRSARSRAARRRSASPGTLAALGVGRRAGAAIVRVHDVAAAVDFLRVVARADAATRAAGASTRTTTRLKWIRARRASVTLQSRVAGRCSPTRPDADRHRHHEGGHPCPSWTAPRSRASPLADLHAIASELGIDGFRRLRKADLIDAILAQSRRGDGAEAPDASEAPAEDEAPRRRRAAAAGAAAPRRRRRRRRRRPGGRGRRDEGASPRSAAARSAPRSARSARRRRRGGRGRRGDRDAEPTDDREAEQVAEGVVELLGNGSAFLRVDAAATRPTTTSTSPPPRCAAASSSRGDRVTRPGARARAARSATRRSSASTRSTASPADEVAEGTPFDDLPARLPTERFALGAEDPTLKAIEWLTPIGRGSRVTITGAPARRQDRGAARAWPARCRPGGLERHVVLAGVAPRGGRAWRADGRLEPAAALTLAAIADAQAQAIERAVDTAQRLAARGGTPSC